MVEVIVIPALIWGLITSLHCIGMCGPIALSLGLSAENKLKFISKNLLYQFGRVATYTTMGVFFGFIGKGISLVGWHQYLSITLGILLIIMAIAGISNLQKPFSFGAFQKLLIKLKTKLGQLMQKKGWLTLFGIGFLNGFLPCGPVYAAVISALELGSVWGGALYMFIFGIATIPTMFIAVWAGNKLAEKWRKKILAFMPVLLFALGVLFILRGMGLGIPYLSPPNHKIELNGGKTGGSCH